MSEHKPQKTNEPVILDNNILSLTAYAEEYPENWKKISESTQEANK